jgi:DNA topoisomerase-3
MRQIADMTRHIVKKAKEYDHETVPGDYATLETPCPNCGGVVKENYRRYTCTGKSGTGTDACGFSFGKTPAGRTFELAEVEQFLRDKRIGPLDGFRSKAGWPFTAELILKYSEEDKNWKLEFDFGNDAEETGELVDFGGQEELGLCPKSGGRVFELGRNYVCEHAVRTEMQPEPTCDFKSRKIILQQPVEREQMAKLLNSGKTDLLDKFVSMRTRRPFKAFLVWDKEAGKVNFEFTPSKFPRKERPARPAFVRPGAAAGGAGTKRGSKRAAKSATPKAPKAPKAAKAPRASTGKLMTPSAALAAVVGNDPVARTQVIKKLWDYIKAQGLQDTVNKRAINADALLLPVFGKPQVTMFELAKVVGPHLS